MKTRTKITLKAISCFVSAKQCYKTFVNITWRAFNLGSFENYFLVLTSYLPSAMAVAENYWPRVVAVQSQTEHSKVRKERSFPLRLEISTHTVYRLVSTLLYGTPAGLSSKIKNTRLMPNSIETVCMKNIPTMEEPMKTLGFTSRLSCRMIKCCHCIKLPSLTLRVNSLIIRPFISLSSHSRRTQTVFH